MKRRPVSILIFIITLNFCFIACKNSPKYSKNDVNIVLIGMDTLRANHLGCYGYDRNTSPNIDQLARDSVLFMRTMAQNPWTLPSFASMFTSLYPSQHKAGIIKEKLEDSYLTLTEILKKNGYYTVGFTGGAYLSEEFGLAQGFDFFNDFNSVISNDIESVIENAIKWLNIERKNKFFMFIHSYQTHSPYWPPPEYDIFYKDYKGKISGDIWNDIGIIQGKLESRYKVLPKEDRERLISLYDSDILYMDYWIGKLLRTLKELNLYNNTLIIFTSDHGEEFNEHGAWEHGHSLYQELLYVPVIIKFPNGKPRGLENKRIALSIDILPTILDVLNIKINSPIEGESLLAIPRRRIAFAQSFPLPNALALVENDMKFILNLDTQKCEIYNLKDDPFEKMNIFSKERFEYYISRIKLYPLIELRKEGFSLDKNKIDEEVLEKLRSLGYIK